MYHAHSMTQHYHAYAAATMTVGKVRQIVMLYDGAIRFVQQAMDAIEAEDYEARFHLISKASAVLNGLQNSLDFDQGGNIARLLYDFYSNLDAHLFAIHRNNQLADCDAVIGELRMMRNAWHEIDCQEKEVFVASGVNAVPGENALTASLSA